MKEFRNITIGVVVVTLVVIAIFNFPLKKIPQGLPEDYFERIEIIEDNNTDVYLLSKQVTFNEDYNSNTVTSLSSIPKSNNQGRDFIVIDMATYEELGVDNDELLETLYKDYCYHVLIINYYDSESEAFQNVLDANNIESNLITLTFDSCGNNFYSGTNTGEFPSLIHMEYALLDQMARIIEENNAS